MSMMESRSVGSDFSCPTYSLFDAVVETATQYPDHVVMHFYQQSITYQTFLRQVEKLSAFLYEKGVRKGDRVGIMLPNCPHYVISFYACARLGATVVQVNPMYTAREVEYTLQDSGAKMLVVLDRLFPSLAAVDAVKALSSVVIAQFVPAELELPANGIQFSKALTEDLPLPEPADVDAAEDVAVLQYTGGTTGRSKGAMLTHRNLIANTVQSIDMIGGEKSVRPDDKILAAIPLFHVYGMTIAMNMAVLAGAAMILLPRFEVEEVLQTIKLHQPRFFPGVPTMYVAIANHPNAQDYGVDSIEICNSGSAPLPIEVKNLFEAKTGATILEGFGLSEASPVTHCNRLDQVRKPGSVGPVAPGTEAAIVDLGAGTDVVPVGELGELIIKGPQVMKGYWNLPEETAVTVRDGWLYTGDIGRMDEDGHFFIVDRKKDMIISSGYNVYPRDVEEVLYQHPNVRECVVVGAPDEYRGETVKAVIVLKEQVEGVDIEAELDTFCRERLAPYKVPRIYDFRAELPKTAVGKILRRALRSEGQPSK